jgi:hypothetical protein
VNIFILVGATNSLLEGLWALFIALVMLGFCVAVLFWSFRSFFRTMRQDRERELMRQQMLKRAREDMPKLLNALHASPDSRQIQEELLQIAQVLPQYSQKIYLVALTNVEQTNGASASKQFSLAAGRLHYGSLRPNGVLTIYDEQAIQNDINARVTTG